MSPHTSSTSIFSVPASERVQQTTTSPSATTAPAKATVPTTTSPTATTTTAPGVVSTPTTTYVPSGATATIPATSVRSTFSGRLVTHPSKHSETLSTGAIVAAAVAALLVLACIGWALARRRAFEPHWLLSLRHAMAEAGFRASATWAEFSDWVRLGH
jgi:hypothetical protein